MRTGAGHSLLQGCYLDQKEAVVIGLLARSHGRQMKSFRASRIVVSVVAIAALSVTGLALVVLQPWQHKRKVLSTRVPQSQYVIELWERPYWYFGFGHEYETWLVVQSPTGEQSWYLIDAEYITLRDVLVLVSSDYQRIRIETNGRLTDFHMIAEYDFRQRNFRAASEQTVRNTEGWAVLAIAHIH